MILVEYLFRLGEILGYPRSLLPWQADQRFDVVAHDGGLGRHRRHHLELLEFRLDFTETLLGHAGGLDLFVHLLEVGTFLAFAELLLDGLDLFVEVILALALLHLPLDPAAYPLLDLEDVEFGLELGKQLLQPLGNIEQFENLLLRLELERQVSRDRVGQPPGFFDARQRSQDLGRYLLVELHVLVELRQDGASHRLDLVTTAFVGLYRRDHGDEQRPGVFDPLDAGPLGAFDEHLDGAVRQLEHLQNVGDAADAVEVAGCRIVLGGRLLRHQQDALSRLHRGLERLDRLRATDEQRDHHVRKHDDVAQGQQGQFRLLAGEIGLGHGL